MSSRLAGRFAVVIAALWCTSTVGLLPADAVQTAQFGLAATGARSKILHAVSDQPIHDAVVVYNRTSSPLTVSLDVVGVTQKADGSYSLGAAGAGLAHDVALQSRSVTLAAKGRRTVGLTINPDGGVKAPAFAAVTAVAGRSSSPGVSVTERLAVLVGLTPPGDVRATSYTPGSSHKRRVAVIVASVLLLAIIALTIVARFRRRR